MKVHDNLKYARRAGSDISILATIISVGDAGGRGVRVRRLEVTDGNVTLPLAVFGKHADREYAAGQKIRAGPVYWSDHYESFSLVRGGTVSVS